MINQGAELNVQQLTELRKNYDVNYGDVYNAAIVITNLMTLGKIPGKLAVEAKIKSLLSAVLADEEPIRPLSMYMQSKSKAQPLDSLLAGTPWDKVASAKGDHVTIKLARDFISLVVRASLGANPMAIISYLTLGKNTTEYDYPGGSFFVEDDRIVPLVAYMQLAVANLTMGAKSLDLAALAKLLYLKFKDQKQIEDADQPVLMKGLTPDLIKLISLLQVSYKSKRSQLSGHQLVQFMNALIMGKAVDPNIISGFIASKPEINRAGRGLNIDQPTLDLCTDLQLTDSVTFARPAVYQRVKRDITKTAKDFSKHYELTHVWSINDRLNDRYREKFDNYRHHTTLFHGTHGFSILPLLAYGFLSKQDRQAASLDLGYDVASYSGNAYGAGTYLTNQVKKAINYSDISGPIYVLICDVGYDHGDSVNDLKPETDFRIAMAHVSGYGFNHNEFVAVHPSQLRFKYLLAISKVKKRSKRE